MAIGKNANDTFLSNYRSGILIHTGKWKNWNPSINMPNRYTIESFADHKHFLGPMVPWSAIFPNLKIIYTKQAPVSEILTIDNLVKVVV